MISRQGRRLIARSEGIMATFVAGVQVYDHNTHTGALPGRILRVTSRARHS